ncbi:M56 family metallopeptidase [Bacteroides sp. KH569_7]|uniref:M56 family metallopeptidase n=1 Tax=Bacteroides muris (ex Fokt et al. 2023) TaxID=2937417 RepID=A0A9X2SWN5_9BACE|nr:M56 family metallopeptidase [Bacteroides muris (ex Fokt et al. 2023)]MCR6508338.1 M56 family metallopeptidase [Bacteroides muris (ex Fokt et al. 2023)]
MVAYFLKVNVAIVLFYAFYRLFFYKDTFFGWHRTALLCFFAVSATVPLLNIQTWIMEQAPTAAMANLYASVVLPELTADAASAPADWKSILSEYANIAYWGMVALLMIRLIMQLAGIIHLACRCRKIQIGNTSIHLLPKADGPFSFFHWIFIHPSSHTEEEFNEILTHEQTHARQWHSIDVIISELVCIFCWCNPFAWLMKREIRTNLEYMADARVLENGYDSKTYQYHLLGLSHQKAAATIYNSFNVLPLKKRIKMMNKKRTKEIGRTKYLMFLPLAALLLIVSNIETVARNSEIWIPALTAIEELPLSIISPEQKGETTFHVTIVDKQGKVVPNVKIQTKLTEQLLNFKTGKDGKVDITLDMSGLKHATMYATSPTGNNFIFLLSRGENTCTINMDEHQYTPPAPAPDENGIFEIVEHMPEFPDGGVSALMEYLRENIKYPEAAMKKGTQGRVIVQFVVEKDGSIANAKVLHGVDPELDKEAVRIVSVMPKWKPGMQRGQAVNVKYTVPIMFRLQKPEKIPAVRNATVAPTK